MAKISIKTPRNTAMHNAGARVQLVWAPTFGARKTAAFTEAQRFVDSEVLRLSTPYVPYQTGSLARSGPLSTTIGTGEVIWGAPYAAKQYGTKPTRSYDARRGGLWFERMKVDHGEQIIKGAKQIAGGGG